MNAPIRTIVAACACLSGCALPDGPSPAPFCLADVEVHSAPERGAAGDFSPLVLFSDVAMIPGEIDPGMIAYGSAGGRSDEITVAGGVLHLARPDGAGGYSERRAPASGEGAYMLQAVTAKSWREPVILGSLPDIDALGSAVASVASTAGCAGPSRLAYRLEGRIVEARWSLETRPQRADYVTVNARAIVVGLYASTDQGRHFVPEGRNIHAHIIFPDLGVAGHLNAVTLEPGASLQLQGS